MDLQATESIKAKRSWTWHDWDGIDISIDINIFVHDTRCYKKCVFRNSSLCHGINHAVPAQQIDRYTGGRSKSCQTPGSGLRCGVRKTFQLCTVNNSGFTVSVLLTENTTPSHRVTQFFHTNHALTFLCWNFRKC